MARASSMSSLAARMRTSKACLDWWCSKPMMNQSSCPRNERELEHEVPLQPSDVLREQADVVEHVRAATKLFREQHRLGLDDVAVQRVAELRPQRRESCGEERAAELRPPRRVLLCPELSSELQNFVRRVACCSVQSCPQRTTSRQWYLMFH